jgi:hypothetical protein
LQRLLIKNRKEHEETDISDPAFDMLHVNDGGTE